MQLDVEKVRERARQLGAKREAIHGQLAKLAAERKSLVALIAAAQAYELALERIHAGQWSAFQVPYRGIRGHRTAHAAQVADQLIEMTGRPVRTPEVLAELLARGSLVASSNPVSAVSARLSLVPHLKGRRDRGWWPVDFPWPDKR